MQTLSLGLHIRVCRTSDQILQLIRNPVKNNFKPGLLNNIPVMMVKLDFLTYDHNKSAKRNIYYSRKERDIVNYDMLKDGTNDDVK